MEYMNILTQKKLTQKNISFNMEPKIDIKISLNGKKRCSSIYVDDVKQEMKTLHPSIKFKVMCELNLVHQFLMNNLTKTLK